MRYSHEFKLMCVDMYRQGKWPDTPTGVKDKTFRDMIRIWSKQEAACGTEGLKHRNQNREWTADEKYAYVAKVLAGESYKEIAISAGIECRLLYEWVRRYKMKGYEGLVAQRKGRPPKEPDNTLDLCQHKSCANRALSSLLETQNHTIRRWRAMRNRRRRLLAHAKESAIPWKSQPISASVPTNKKTGL